jgi:hypothetical protein
VTSIAVAIDGVPRTGGMPDGARAPLTRARARAGTTRKNEFGERSLSRLCKLARLRSHRARFPAAGGVRYCDLKVGLCAPACLVQTEK